MPNTTKHEKISAGTGPVPTVRRSYNWDVLKVPGDFFDVKYINNAAGRKLERTLRSQASKVQARRRIHLSVSRRFDANDNLIGCRVSLVSMRLPRKTG